MMSDMTLLPLAKTLVTFLQPGDLLTYTIHDPKIGSFGRFFVKKESEPKTSRSVSREIWLQTEHKMNLNNL